MTYKVGRRGLSVVGLDMEMLAIKYAQQELAKRNITNTRFVQATGEDLPFSDQVFDGVIAMELVEHLDSSSTAKLLEGIKRVCKPGGVLVVTTPHKQSETMSSPYHVQEFSAPELKALLGRYFPRVEVLGYFSPHAAKVYSWGGAPLKPVRLIWKMLAKTNIYNPFTVTTANPGHGWDNLIGAARLAP
jgi:2-polyprenyl-3-methyl-5-hydroxy-6-metoxy-1,4-benzoquinol methylase